MRRFGERAQRKGAWIWPIGTDPNGAASCDPRDLLKLYIGGYFNEARSSRV